MADGDREPWEEASERLRAVAEELCESGFSFQDVCQAALLNASYMAGRYIREKRIDLRPADFGRITGELFVQFQDAADACVGKHGGGLDTFRRN